MSASESKKVTLVIPAVQPQHVAVDLPEGVLFCSPGLREATGASFFVSPELPMNPSEARGQLHELLQYGLSFRSARDMSSVVLAEKATQHDAPEPLNDEFADLDAFAATGEFVPTEKEEPVVDAVLQARIAAQKTLLLAWDMEQRIAELGALKDKFTASSANMDAILGITDEDDLEELPGIEPKAALVGDVEEDLGMPWRAVAAAIIEFSPKDTRFVAVKKELADVLTEIGEDITLDSITAEEYGFSLPENFGWKLYSVKAYELLGHTRVPEGWECLNRTVEIFTVA
ncbi:hypothetical protein [Halodesulfovibrio marinisediminis]|uniref:Uncharacterized protein n=1 Tax=Halodesulfovibrio marinisediminis DSM 17456 TaxID=1121457 RepID=A0A1N6DU59_9BACT|nr:hypothetical protein [Halodesulfovibrio marinisediminis]SIN74301.1 hypothetical protein SAMN02745161_0485 [Halodesulfovibrio marinisediminis DSM 17456]